MKHLIYIIILLFSNSIYSQNSDAFRRDYNYFSMYENDKWGEVKETRVSVIFNINNNRDIKVVFYGGKEKIYRRISDVEKDNVDGKEYQIVSVLDDKGSKFYFQLFDNFLKIFNNDTIIQLNE